MIVLVIQKGQQIGVDPTVVSPAAIWQQEHSFLYPTTKLEYQSLRVLGARHIRNQSFLVGDFLDLILNPG